MARDGRLTTPPGWVSQGADPADLAVFVNERCWKDWLDAYRPWWRQVEENCRMLGGRQWDIYLEGLGDFVDVASYFTIDDERWRRYPVFNWLAHYYKLSLSKLTESPPAIGYLPHSPDERDARLAAVMEPVWKSAWFTMDMPEQVFDLYGWVLSAARGITKLSWDPDRGPADDFRDNAIVQLLGPDGTIAPRELTDAPYILLPDGSVLPGIGNDFAMGDDGAPLFVDDQPVFLPAEGEDAEDGIRFLPPTRDRLGDLSCEICAPVSVIVPHGPEPFHRKRWYTHQYLMHVDEVQRRFDKVVEPMNIPVGEMLELRLQYGTNYGMPGRSTGGFGISSTSEVALRDHTVVRELWMRDVPRHPILEKGRLAIVTGDGEVLYDDINPYWVEASHREAVIPFEAFDLVRYPFRQEGSADLEIMNPIQRAVNRRMGGLMDASDMNEQPLTLKKRQAQIDEDDEKLNKPGAVAEYTDTPGRAPVERIPAADLPRGSIELTGMLREWMQILGSQPFGSEGLPVTTDASGELQREVRFDVDRVWGATLRRHGYTWPRFALTMIGIYDACMSDDRLFTLAGEDQAWNFVTVGRDAWAGAIHAYPQPESMVLETRQEKQNRLLELRERFPEIPAEVFIDLLGYPDLARLTRPGGPAWAMAERENLEMLLGVLPPVLEEHDHQSHILNHRRKMQSIEYRNLDPQIQQLFRVHVQIHEMLGQQEQLRQVALAAPVAMAQAGVVAGATMPGAGGGAAAGPSKAGNGKPAFADDSRASKRAPSRQDLASGRMAPGEADPRFTAKLE